MRPPAVPEDTAPPLRPLPSRVPGPRGLAPSRTTYIMRAPNARTIGEETVNLTPTNMTAAEVARWEKSMSAPAELPPCVVCSAPCKPSPNGHSRRTCSAACQNQRKRDAAISAARVHAPISSRTRRHHKPGPAQPSDHSHHWVIDTPNGTPKSAGRCKVCGETREYWNSMASDREGVAADFVIHGRNR